jgi:DNA-binding transcriptional ArsR family regulator
MRIELAFDGGICFNSGMQDYVPIPWRVCRALDNPLRLEMLRVIFNSRRPMSVGDISAAVDEKESVTSQYLRILNIQGFVVAVRRGKNVFYERRREGNGDFMRLLLAIEKLFTNGDWKERVLNVLPAFSNARKTIVLSILQKEGEMSIELLAEKAFMPVKTCYRIVGELIGLGFVKDGSGNAAVSIARLKPGFANAMFSFTTNNSHIL